MHEVRVNRLGGLSLPKKSVVRLTERPDMTLDVYHGRKTTMQQQQQPVCVCVFQNLVQPITSSCMVEFGNNLAQMIIITKRYVTNKNHVARSKVKVTVHT